MPKTVTAKIHRGLLSTRILLVYGLVLLVPQGSNAQIDLGATVQDVSCFGFNNGSISLNVTGGVGPYHIYWLDSGSTGPTISGLAPGLHIVQVTDVGANHNTFAQVSVSQPDELIVYLVDHYEASCYGLCDAGVSLEIQGGMPPYSINWPTGAIVSADGLTANGLCPGINVLNILDANQCSVSVSTLLEEPEGLSMELGVSILNCGANAGSIELNVFGGAPPYSILSSSSIINWSFTSQGFIGTGLSEGDYSVIVGDYAGCTITGAFSVDGLVVPGTPCDDGNNQTINDVMNSNCECVGEPNDCNCVFTTVIGYWNDSNNWSCNIVPTADCEVIIPNNTLCVVGPQQIANCKSLCVEAESELYLSETATLNAWGN